MVRIDSVEILSETEMVSDTTHYPDTTGEIDYRSSRCERETTLVTPRRTFRHSIVSTFTDNGIPEKRIVNKIVCTFAICTAIIVLYGMVIAIVPMMVNWISQSKTNDAVLAQTVVDAFDTIKGLQHQIAAKTNIQVKEQLKHMLNQ